MSSIFSYGDIKTILEQSLDSPRGLRVRFTSAGAAQNFIFRLNSFRKADRISNSKIYGPDDPLYKASPYDGLTFSKVVAETGEAEVKILKQASVQFDIEEL